MLVSTLSSSVLNATPAASAAAWARLSCSAARTVSGETVPLVGRVGRFHNGFGTDRGWLGLAKKIRLRSNLRILFHIADDGLPTVVRMNSLRTALYRGSGLAASSGKQKPIKIQGPKPRQPKCRIPTSQKRSHHTRAA